MNSLLMIVSSFLNEIVEQESDLCLDNPDVDSIFNKLPFRQAINVCRQLIYS